MRVDEALDAVRMKEFAAYTPSKLSGGQKQRIAIAGVLAMKPDCIVLDEPTAMLDPVGRRDVMETIERLNKEEGITVILITHYMDEAERCHKVAYLSYGRLLANGTIASIIASQNLITMRTSGAGLTLLESQLQRLPDIEQTVIFGNQLYITSRDEAKLKSALFAFTQQGYEFCKVDTNLEDAFTYLMKNNCEKN